MARPSIEGTHVSPTAFQIRPELLDTMIEGASVLARRIGEVHPKKRTPSPSNAHWLRVLIEFASIELDTDSLRWDACSDLTPVPSLHARNPQVTATIAQVVRPTSGAVRVSLRISDEQRIILRKIECAGQALDWTVDFNHTAVMNLLVMLFGQKLNQALLHGSYPPPERSSLLVTSIKKGAL